MVKSSVIKWRSRIFWGAIILVLVGIILMAVQLRSEQPYSRHYQTEAAAKQDCANPLPLAGPTNSPPQWVCP